jgi:predicted AAA+ superfamily ATPase
MLNVMNVERVNNLLLLENIDLIEVLSKLKKFKSQPLQFQHDFGLERLPEEPGIILIRGARQFGKSTWLERQIEKSYREYGPGSALYLNGDEIALAGDLVEVVEKMVPLFSSKAKVKRLFIDEITAIDKWERGIKLLSDRGLLADILVVTTGSSASDIRRGAERLPGRKGRLRRSNYIFTPCSYKEFCRVATTTFGDNTLTAYILSGGSPLAANELAEGQQLPDFIISLTRDWLIGEVVRSGRQRSMLIRVFEFLHKNGVNPVSYSKLARDADFANNTVASGYIEHLQDLLCVAPTIQCDPRTERKFYRKSMKLALCNLLMAVATSPYQPRSISDFMALPATEQGKFYEWLVAQELWRRNSLRELEYQGELSYYRDGEHELDFIVEKNSAIEVKRGQASPHEFQWLYAEHPNLTVKVICTNTIDMQRVSSVSMEEFLLSEG